MGIPPETARSSERVLKKNEIEKLPCTHKVREIASTNEGIIIESEVVTEDARFGYIYRYNIVTEIFDEGSLYQKIRMKGIIQKYKRKLMIHTLDCIHLKILSLPGRIKAK